LCRAAPQYDGFVPFSGNDEKDPGGRCGTHLFLMNVQVMRCNSSLVATSWYVRGKDNKLVCDVEFKTKK